MNNNTLIIALTIVVISLVVGVAFQPSQTVPLLSFGGVVVGGAFAIIKMLISLQQGQQVSHDQLQDVKKSTDGAMGAVLDLAASTAKIGAVSAHALMTAVPSTMNEIKSGAADKAADLAQKASDRHEQYNLPAAPTSDAMGGASAARRFFTADPNKSDVP